MNVYTDVNIAFHHLPKSAGTVFVLTFFYPTKNRIISCQGTGS